MSGHGARMVLRLSLAERTGSSAHLNACCFMRSSSAASHALDVRHHPCAVEAAFGYRPERGGLLLCLPARAGDDGLDVLGCDGEQAVPVAHDDVAGTDDHPADR